MKIKALIIDDDPNDILIIKQTLESIINRNNYPFLCSYYTKLSAIDYTDLQDLYILDIDMPAINGFAVAEAIYHHNQDAVIIFCTNHNDLVFESFRLNTFYFVRKDHLQKDLNNALTKFAKIFQKKHTFYFYHNKDETIRIPYSKIIYIEVNLNYLFIHTDNTEYKEKKSLKKMLEELQNNIFVQIDRNFIVNTMHIIKIDKNKLFLRNDLVFNISRRYLSEVRKQYSRSIRS